MIKADLLTHGIKSGDMKKVYIIDSNGTSYYGNNVIGKAKTNPAYINCITGANFISEPYIDQNTNNLIITMGLPIKDNGRIIGVLASDLNGYMLNKFIQDLKIAKTGDAYIIGKTGVTIADPDPECVKNQESSIEEAKTDPTYKAIAEFEQKALSESTPDIGYFDWDGLTNIGAFSKIPGTDWAVIVSSEEYEFLDSVEKLKFIQIIMEIVINVCAIILMIIIAQRITKPLKATATALKNISQGEGDLTLRLPEKGKDEVADVCHYFNKTIEKIHETMSTVVTSSESMKENGHELSTNMIETAGAVNEISATIESIKTQVINQSASVTETSATISTINQNIQTLTSSIDNQVSCVSKSSQSIEKMINNIEKIGQMLNESNTSVEHLRDKTVIAQDGSCGIIGTFCTFIKLFEEC